MKAVILLAGAGRRLHPLTLDRPKSLLPIGDSTVLEHMITKLLRAGIHSFVVVCGFMEGTIKAYIGEAFPDLDVAFVTNEHYLTTNTGYSLLAACRLILSMPIDSPIAWETGSRLPIRVTRPRSSQITLMTSSPISEPSVQT